MERFWKRSWERVDPERVAGYVRSIDMEPDALIAALHRHSVKTVCDAGCGCGAYALKLAANGFSVCGFDVSSHAVQIAQALLGSAALTAELKTAGILSTGYADGAFDGVICRDVLDHLPRADAAVAVKELCRITKPGGIVIVTLDPLDEEYRTEPHRVNLDGDYVYTAGKWNGMIFHPYTVETVRTVIPEGTLCEITDTGGELTVLLKNAE